MSNNIDLASLLKLQATYGAGGAPTNAFEGQAQSQPWQAPQDINAGYGVPNQNNGGFYTAPPPSQRLPDISNYSPAQIPQTSSSAPQTLAAELGPAAAAPAARPVIQPLSSPTQVTPPTPVTSAVKSLGTQLGNAALTAPNVTLAPQATSTTSGLKQALSGAIKPAAAPIPAPSPGVVPNVTLAPQATNTTADLIGALSGAVKPAASPTPLAGFGLAAGYNPNPTLPPGLLALLAGGSGVATAPVGTTATTTGLSSLPSLLSGGAAPAARPAVPSGLVYSDERVKTDIEGSGDVADMLDKLKAKSYLYKDPTAQGARPGRQIGVMAQDLEKSPLGAQFVIDTPEGKKVDYGKAASTMMAGLAYHNERLHKLEKLLK